MITPQPLPKTIHAALVELGIETLTLQFEGGHDEGYLYIDATEKDTQIVRDLGELESKIEDWALDAYQYSGAGDGVEYGDDITYNLVNNTVTVQEWFMEKTFSEGETSEMGISEE